ncbi:BN860_10528g1_1 [Zygosaccharomyces bailii CLIB 213]|uniref:ATP-dependent RNA helicase n=1 Tax=Zygosaccharomyces bailii (strain CLIB 213 / ATCC 58445 / CBS 680 / BCRC 21525 / NBRC 1098 / NCYC 1416 / NRRL Y-2227) TaxID=1333698 RepID=A0A8J2T4B1_ZYGB2|nr:BN860_10528g1_1 [Zygosaccharomyces bailii CLIB 213]
MSNSSMKATKSNMVKKHSKVAKGKSNLSKKKNTKPKIKGKSQRKTPKSVIVAPSELKWKKVDIPDSLDDYGGFYGLEEIDGVDVRVVNGKAEFITRDESVLKNEGEHTKQNVEESQDYHNQNTHTQHLPVAIEDEQNQNEELKREEDLDNSISESRHDGAQDNQDSQSQETEKKADDSDDEIQHKNSPLNEIVQDRAGKNQEGEQDQELQQNTFNADLDLDDLTVPELPDWSEVAPLSFTVLLGLSQQGFTKPTDIQRAVLPAALRNEDIMGKAATGSGKTLAYGIPILESFVKEKDLSKPIALIFTPTRELAQQVTEYLKKLGQLVVKESPFAILSLTGGLSIQKQERLLNYDNSASIVVATPGRFLELIEKNDELVSRFAQIKTLVLDEADRLLQDGHFEEFERILKLLGSARKTYDKIGWQTMIFSATFSMTLFSKLTTTSWKSLKNNEDELEQVLKHLMQKIHFKSKPLIIDSNSEEKVKSEIKESLIECGPLERDLYSYYFLTVFPGTTLIFCNSIDSVKKLCAYFNNLKISAFQIHSSMTQKNRLVNLERYLQQSTKNSTEGKSTVLVASDVAARGLDIPGIKHVIHYHLPRTADTYIHRSGRTARAGHEGVSVMICSPEEAMGPLRKLRKMLADKGGEGGLGAHKKWQKEVPLLPIEPDIVRELRERSVLANELADHQLASASLNKDSNWMKQAAQDLGVDIDSDDEFNDPTINKKRKKTLSKVEAKQVKSRLNSLLNRPIRKDRRQKYLTGGFTNLADNLVKKRGHESIIGHEKVGALETLKSNKKRKEK